MRIFKKYFEKTQIFHNFDYEKNSPPQKSSIAKSFF